MSVTATKKVGGTDKEGKSKKRVEGALMEKKGRSPFDISTAKYRNAEGQLVSAVNGNGKLIAVPLPIVEGDNVIYSGWDIKTHKPLSRKDFATDDVFMDYRVYVLDHQIAQKQALRNKMAKAAERLRKFGDEKTRRKAAKLEKMRQQMEALQRELAAEGVDLSDLSEE